MLVRANPSYSGSVELYQRAQQYLAGGVSSNFRLGGNPAPLYFKAGEGSTLVDVDGNTYIDYALGMGPVILGHAHPAVSAAVSAALQSGQLFAGQHAAEVELAERVCELMPNLELVRFGSSGSEMVQVALRLARAFTGKMAIIKFEGHYHGWIDGIYANSAPESPAPPGAEGKVQLASAGQNPAATQDLIVLPWNDIDALERAFLKHGNRVAGLIMEPILCNTSVITPSSGYVAKVRELCDEHNSLLIFDEVITGFRVALSGAQSLLGVKPDLTILAKAIANGFPLAAIGGRRKIMQLLGDGSVMHGGTYNTNVSSVAAANATLATLSADSGAPVLQMLALGQHLMDELKVAAASARVPLQVQGFGSVFNTTFIREGSLNEPILGYSSYVRTDLDRQRLFIRALQDHGIRVTGRGTWFLSTAHTERQVTSTVDAVRAVLKQ